MLRSLVGSEMCIRDRCQHSRAASEDHRQQLGQCLDQWLSPTVDRGPRRACLLYTSDAADDLLCVDLGGRRIIIKKNKHLCQP